MLPPVNRFMKICREGLYCFKVIISSFDYTTLNLVEQSVKIWPQSQHELH